MPKPIETSLHLAEREERDCSCRPSAGRRAWQDPVVGTRRSRRVMGAALIGAVAILFAGAAPSRGSADSPIIFAPTSKGLFVAPGDAGGSIALNFLPATAPLPRKF